VSALVTALLVLLALALLGLIVLGPFRAVREDRRLAAAERGWLESAHFPARVERRYRNPRLILTDGTRLRALGYDLEQRRTARGNWGRVLVVVWRAARPPAGAP
jgi:hypothetical protein